MNTKAIPDKSWWITKSPSYKTLAAVMFIKAKCYTNFNGRNFRNSSLAGFSSLIFLKQRRSLPK